MDNNIESANHDVINIRDLLFKYLRKWYWFVLAVIIAFVLTFFYLKSTNEKYNIQTTIMLRNDDNKSGGGDQRMMLQNLGLFNSSKALEDEIQIINSHKIIGEAIDTLLLQTEYYEKVGLKYVERYGDLPLKLITPPHLIESLTTPIEIYLKGKAGNHIVKFKCGSFKKTYKLLNIQEPFSTPLGELKFSLIKATKPYSKYKILVQPKNSLVESYSGKIQAGAINKQSISAIRISMVESNTKKAEDLLNKIVELYNLDAITDKNIIATNTAKFLKDRLTLITQELFNVESDVEQYKKSNSITDITSEAGIYLQSSSEYGKKIVELETQLKLVQYIEGYIKGDKNQYSLIPANIGIQDEGLVNLTQEYNKVILERMKLLKTTNDNNPTLVDLTEQIDALRHNVIISVANVKSGLVISKKDILGKESEFSSRIKAVPTQERQFLEIKRQQEIKQNLYLFLYQKKEENDLTLASTAPAARTIDKAYASLTPVAPKRSMIYLIALILGVLVPFIVIYLKDLINNKIEDAKEFQKAVKAPYLGNICISREAERVVVEEGKVTPIVEMFRLIRTNLQFMTGSKKSPVILVTSTISGEGKSFISINLAMSFALMKKKIVLVGMDIRNPMLGDYMHIPKKNGLTVYLADDSYSVKDVIVPSGFHNYLDVIPAGPVPPNPSELLMNSRLDDLIAELKNNYDFIIVDSAPIGVVSDTYLLSRFVDNSVFVARQDYTPNDSCLLINDIYKEKRLKELAVVLNGTPATSNYGYGYGYGSDYRRKQSQKAAPKLTFGDKINELFYKLFNGK
ncbi:MAG: polysaccharide biosynthesis tyrosine autokinase [Paludibacteraceae bacterium]